MSERSTALSAATTTTRHAARWASPRFFTCVLLLATAAVSMHALTLALGAYFRKEAVPLRKPLDALRLRSAQAPYVLRPEPPSPLSEDVLQSLGTTEYAVLYIRDTSQPPSAPAAQASVFITYYTGQPDMVPHTPDECYVAGGFKKGTPSTTIKKHATGIGAPDDEVPVRVLGFSAPVGAPWRSESGDDLTVMYLFYCNGQYMTTRDEVRLALGNLFQKYAYYAKIEVRFTTYDERGPNGGAPADRAASLEAIGPLLQRLMAVLRDEHLADWGTLTGSGPTTREGR
jgi:hypothetical protein